MEFLRFLSEQFDIAVIVFIALLLLILYIVRRAEQAAGFSWAPIFQDDSGKVSALRVAILVSIAVSSAVLLYITVNLVKNQDDLKGLFEFYIAYLAVWSGAKVVEKLIDLLVAKFVKT